MSGDMTAGLSTPSRHDRPRSVYVHVPFCQHRCGYCDFSLLAGRDDLVPKYLAALERELLQTGADAEIDTLYIGGGTPTRLGVIGLQGLFRLVQRHFHLAEGYEWTVEANPNDVQQALTEFLGQAGVNRISLGVQSFQQAKLQHLDRRHTEADNQRAISLLQPLFVISLDLIFAAPQETLEAWQFDLQQALRWRPQHLSCYGLTYEKGTPFFGALQQQKLEQIDESLQRQMYLTTIDAATHAGYEHYEVSSFALPGHRSRHNQAYWQCRPYYAFGPGAASYVGGVRRLNHRSPIAYMQKLLQGTSAMVEEESISDEMHARERLVFGLRMLDGIDAHRFQQETGYDLFELGGAALNRHIDQGWLQVSAGRVCLTSAGLLISDSLWPDLIAG